MAALSLLLLPVLVPGAAAESTGVVLIGTASSGSGGAWLSAWRGQYRADGVQPINGRQSYVKVGEKDKILYYASSLGYWHFGHPHDVSKNAAMIAAKSSAATPDKTGVNWRIVAHSSLSEERWQRAPNLMVVASPPPTIWLYGHAPLGYFGRGIFSRGWLGDWLGAYDLEVAHGLGGMSGSGRGGGPAQLRYAKRGCGGTIGCEVLWYVPPPAYRQDGSSRSGSGGDDGGEVGGWLLGWSDDEIREDEDEDEEDQAAASGVWLSVAGAHPPGFGGAMWRIRGENGEWVPAPGIACTANATEVIGHYASVGRSLTSEANLTRWCGFGAVDSSGCTLPRLFERGGRALDALSEHVAKLAESLRNGMTAVLESSGMLPMCTHVLETSIRVAIARPSSPKIDGTAALDLDIPLRALVVPLIWWLMLIGAYGCYWRWRMGDGSGDGSDDATGESDDECDEQSSEEKRLAFTCLSAAIEDVKGRVNEQQYVALYNAALWCFNLTPHWAEGKPVPPPPLASEAGQGQGQAQVPPTEPLDSFPPPSTTFSTSATSAPAAQEAATATAEATATNATGAAARGVRATPAAPAADGTAEARTAPALLEALADGAMPQREGLGGGPGESRPTLLEDRPAAQGAGTGQLKRRQARRRGHQLLGQS